MVSDDARTAAPTLDRAFDLYEAGDPIEAAEVCQSILERDGNHYGALYLLGSISGERRQFASSISLLRKAIEVNPTKPVAHYNLANVLDLCNRPREALAAIDSYIALVQDNGDAHILRAVICAKLQRFDDSLQSSERAVELKPDSAWAHNVRGNALANLRRSDEAIAAYEKAIALKPDHAEAYYNRGNAMKDLWRYEEAFDNYDKAIARKEDFAEAHFNQGSVLRALKRLGAAMSHYEKTRTLAPNMEFLPGIIHSIRQQMCDWSAYEEETETLKRSIETSARAADPFQVLSISHSNALNKRAARIFIEAKTGTSGAAEAFVRRSRGGKIRVGYFSADFHEHATGQLIAEVFERHDKNQFDVIGFSFGPDTGDAMRKRLMAAFGRFNDVSRQSDRQIAELARRLEIDIAIDLKGFTEASRPEIFAHRAAPIQVNYLGYPGTMGAEFIDYIVADRLVAPESQQGDYVEKIAYLPNSYQPNDGTRPIAATPYTRANCSLPERGFVYCCFNNNYKIAPDVFDGWMRILKQTPGAVLWLLADNDVAVENLRKEARMRAVDPDRLIFAARMPTAEHLARHRLADLFLDTLPYNAHTTASDALWAGLPVLTRIGETFAGRVAASLLMAVGLPELITKSRAEYEALAVELATNPGKLAGIKLKLAQNRLTTPLFDAGRYTRNLEAAYRAMYERYHAGLPPDHIYVEP